MVRPDPSGEGTFELTEQWNLTVIIIMAVRGDGLDVLNGRQRQRIQRWTSTCVGILGVDDSGEELVQGILLRRLRIG